MANPPQVPQHVTALLSHLTSRPGVQSTLILSRKDGSIIQRTGQLAPQEPTSRPAPTTSEQTTPPSDTDPAPVPAQIPQVSQAEALAAHIFAFVSSASALGVSLSNPTPQSSDVLPPSTSTPALDGESNYGNGSRTPREEDRDENTDREEDEEVKLLRMRTRKHEIVVVPDRKYLLCVVHDASHASGGPGARGTRSSR
ncbi:uncharacterized protein N7484_001016 [Penicillium longicatenatum]|uniref:uncharacterized protein n=1 Tax=Penicillium longicatenatum TaxID=1561947 RepID=UPI002546A3DE|nr:uncharacterized protein N7484_001016 [Penicillium longicatenatum]KAJ5657367.1 hypothetical protein N7484_001016 [Penicillium longicatenatum]